MVALGDVATLLCLVDFPCGPADERVEDSPGAYWVAIADAPCCIHGVGGVEVGMAW